MAAGKRKLPNLMRVSDRGRGARRAGAGLPEVVGPAVGPRLLFGAARRRVEPDQLDGIAYADLAAGEHARVDAALARMPRLAHALDIPVAKPLGVLPAGRRVRRDLEVDLTAEPHLDARNHERPVERADGDVLPCGARGDRMALRA